MSIFLFFIFLCFNLIWCIPLHIQENTLIQDENKNDKPYTCSSPDLIEKWTKLNVCGSMNDEAKKSRSSETGCIKVVKDFCTEIEKQASRICTQVYENEKANFALYPNDILGNRRTLNGDVEKFCSSVYRKFVKPCLDGSETKCDDMFSAMEEIYDPVDPKYRNDGRKIDFPQNIIFWSGGANAFSASANLARKRGAKAMKGIVLDDTIYGKFILALGAYMSDENDWDIAHKNTKTKTCDPITGWPMDATSRIWARASKMFANKIRQVDDIWVVQFGKFNPKNIFFNIELPGILEKMILKDEKKSKVCN
jgi:hypothetical protein